MITRGHFLNVCDGSLWWGDSRVNDETVTKEEYDALFSFAPRCRIAALSVMRKMPELKAALEAVEVGYSAAMSKKNELTAAYGSLVVLESKSAAASSRAWRSENMDDTDEATKTEVQEEQKAALAAAKEGHARVATLRKEYREAVTAYNALPMAQYKLLEQSVRLAGERTGKTIAPVRSFSEFPAEIMLVAEDSEEADELVSQVVQA